MGLKPLEFEDCILDSPYFRENIHEHERELERTNEAIKGLIKECKTLLKAFENLSKAQRSFAQVLNDLRFEYIGEVETDDELLIADALKEFGRMIDSVEDERDRMLHHANSQLIVPLETFRKEQIGGFKEEKKKFDKQTEKFCLSVQNYLNLSSRKKDSILSEADSQLQMEKRAFHQTALDYVVKLQEVNEKKKFEFVETLLSFMYGHMTFFHSGHEVFNDYMEYMTDLTLRLQNTRERFDTAKTEAETLMTKVQQKAQSGELQYHGAHTRQGYLGVQKKGSLGTTWSKHYCMYTKENKILTMIPYTQTQGRLNANTDTMVVQSCVRKMTDSIDRRFTFEITALERSQPILLQAQDEEDRKSWLAAMDGKEPLYMDSNSIPKLKDPETKDLELTFISKCISAVEKRGITDQGLYRIVGVGSKVQNLLLQCIDKKKVSQISLADEDCEWEVKTITSALKQYLRNMAEPLFTYSYHEQFLDAVKKETYEKRIEALTSLVATLPEENRKLITTIMKHLKRVAAHSNKNLMAASNLGVVFGPTLMKSREESMAAIMNLKYQSVVIELLIKEFDTIFGPDSPDSDKSSDSSPNSTSVSINTNPFLDDEPEISSNNVINNKPKPPPKKRNSDDSGTKLNDSGHVTPTKPLPLPSKAYRAPPPPSAKPLPKTRVKAVVVSADSEEDLSNTSDSSSSNSASQNGVKRPISPREFWKEKAAGKPTPPPKKPEVVAEFKSRLEDSSRPFSMIVSTDEKESAPAIRRVSSQSGNLNRGLQSWGTGPPPLPREPPPQEEPPPSLQTKTPKKVKTIYPCVAENSSELSFDAGIVITNVRPSKEPGWLEGTLNGRTGLVPENYVEPIT